VDTKPVRYGEWKLVRIVGCIPIHHEARKSKLSEIERLIQESNAHILLLPEEYFGGLRSNGKFEAFSSNSRLFHDISNIAQAYSCGIVVGLIESEREKKFQSMWFFNEKGEHVGTERKYSLARYEIFHYGLSRADGFNRECHTINGTRGTTIFCWEIHDIRSRKACDDVTPDWIFNAIKFPPDCLTDYVVSGSRRILRKVTTSEEVYAEWIGKMKSLASDLIALVVASCGTFFSLCTLPKGAKSVAGIVHPDNKISKTRFRFGPEHIVEQARKAQKGVTAIERGFFGTIACTNIPGSFVCLDFQNEISLLRMGPRSYEAKHGQGTYPKGISVSARAWQLRHLGNIQDDKFVT